MLFNLQANEIMSIAIAWPTISLTHEDQNHFGSTVCPRERSPSTIVIERGLFDYIIGGAIDVFIHIWEYDAIFMPFSRRL